MARLYDRIIARHGVDAAPDTPGGFASDLRYWTRDPPVVVSADAPTKMFWIDRGLGWEPQDFPNVAPPFPRVFVESRLADGSAIHTVGGKKLAVSAFGVMFDADEAKQDGRGLGVGWWSTALVVLRFGKFVVPVVRAPLDIGLSGEVLMPENGGIHGYDPDARFVGATKDSWRAVSCLSGTSSENAEAALLKIGIAALGAAMFTVSLMHCKNVEVRIVEPPRLSPHLKRKGVKPKVRYHVLDIDPMKKTLKTEGRSGEVGLKRALHICRGHFATYTEDAPLFGKYVGTFWKPQHVRGSAKHGAVVKDYNVKAPK